MIFEDYIKFIMPFKEICKGFPLEHETLVIHFDDCNKRIKDLSLFIKCWNQWRQHSPFFPSHVDLADQVNSIITSQPKIETKETAYDLGKRVNWLIWEIEQKVRAITEYQSRNLHRAVKILNRELKELQFELDWRQGRAEKPVNKYDGMEPELKALYDQLINKQLVLVACKKEETFCDNIKAEIRAIENKIAVIENKQLDATPF